MNNRLSDIQLRRGRLQERIAAQRTLLAQEIQPIRAVLQKTDRIVGRVRSFTDYVKQHPTIASLAVAGLVVMKTGRVWRWSRRAFFAWQSWRVLSDKWTAFGSRTRS